MLCIWSNDVARTTFVATLLCSFTASATDISTNASVGLRYTDNAGLTSDNEINETIVTTSVGAAINTGGGPFKFNAKASALYEHYSKDTFADQQVYTLGMTAGWVTFKNRLDWTLEDYFTQQSIDSLSPDVPDNRQDTNVLTFGPNIYFPISARQTITLKPEYRKFTYESQNADNQQSSLNANWGYQLFRNMNLSLNAGIRKVDYDDSVINGNRFRNFSLIASGQRSRSNYSLSLGATRVDTENGGGQRGFAGSMTWLLNITDTSSIRTNMSSDLTDANNGLLNFSRSPEDGDFSNEQISSDVSRNSVIRVAYNKKNERLNSSVWSELRKQKYELTTLDREVQDYGIKFNYPLTAILSTGLSTRYSSTKVIDVGRVDDEYSLNVNFNYRLSRKFSVNLDLKYQEKKTNIGSGEFDELSAFASLVYSSGGR